MHKKLYLAFVAMVILTALMAAMLVGCSMTVKHEIEINSNVSDGTTTTQTPIETVIVTIGDGTDETMVVGGGVVDRGDEEDTGTSKPTNPTTNKDSGSETEPTTSKESTTNKDPSKDTTTTPTKPSGPNLSLTFEEYLAMTGEQQEAHYDSFESTKAFVAWFDAAKAVWQEQNKGTEVTGPGVNLEDYINK